MKKKTITQLNKKLWKIVSEYIRRRDKGICFTCGRYYWDEELGENNWKKMQAGHYRTGATCNKTLYFDERNIHCQCFNCNINLSGNWREYQKRMHMKYGKDIDSKFDKINQKPTHDYDYEKQIKEFSVKLKDL